jgi:signal transduction histidine kinase
VRRRVLLSILLAVAATVIALGVPLGIVSWQLITDHEQSDLAGRLDSATATLAAQPPTGPVDLEPVRAAVPVDGLLIVQLPGRAAAQLAGGEYDAAVTDRFSQTVELPTGGSATLSVPAAGLHQDRWAAMLAVAAAVLLSIAVGAASALVLARRLAKPLSEVAGRAARLGAGDFRPNARRWGIAELDRVAEVLDASAGQLASLVDRERELVADVTHQLRTRLTGLRLQLEELAEPGVDDLELQDAAAAALEQTDQLAGVVDDLLANARERRSAGAGPVVLGGELRAVVGDWERRFAAARRAVRLQLPDEPVVVRATVLRLREALDVLLDNALRHGAGTVTVTVRAGAATVVVEVSDEGAGVSSALSAHIFDRGVSTASSSGIGLPLARSLVESDGGRLELRQREPPVFALYLSPAADIS